MIMRQITGKSQPVREQEELPQGQAAACRTWQERIKALHLCVIVPTYNNRQTLADVLNGILLYTSSVIVVNDGSTDRTDGILNDFAGKIKVLSYWPNRGKGYALKCGFDKAEKLGYRRAITIDSDGQHFAADMERFVGYAEKYPDALLIGQRLTEGNMPVENSFANTFSNFWFTVQTAYRLQDTQNGFRLYPLSAMKGLRPVSSRYEAELEILVRSAWRGIRIIPVPARVYYPPEGKRITHFRPGKDFFRISVLNTVCTLLAIVYGYPAMLFHRLFTRKSRP
jgi:glycosyltransferase involved in cell wall biosynthesis